MAETRQNETSAQKHQDDHFQSLPTTSPSENLASQTFKFSNKKQFRYSDEKPKQDQLDYSEFSTLTSDQNFQQEEQQPLLDQIASPNKFKHIKDLHSAQLRDAKARHNIPSYDTGYSSSEQTIKSQSHFSLFSQEVEKAQLRQALLPKQYLNTDDLENPNQIIADFAANATGLEARDDHDLIQYPGAGADEKPQTVAGKLYWWLDATDKSLSEYFLASQSQLLGAVLFPFAFTFNRARIVFPIFAAGFVGYFRYDTMLEYNGFTKLTDTQASESVKYSLGAVSMLFYALCLLVMVLSTQGLKYTIRRERPADRGEETPRCVNMRMLEHGTFSMPSGDACAATVFCVCIAYEFELFWIYAILPLVCIGRVYYHCHWLGDTLVGLFIGHIWGALGVMCFPHMVPLFAQITGPGIFVEAAV